MRYHVLVSDYDGTLAHHGKVDAATCRALERVRESGRRLVLATGRELPDLLRVFPKIDLFDRVVAENGALLYRPTTREEIPLTDAPPAALIQRLTELGVAPVSVGRGIVATWEPHETAALNAIRDLGIEYHVVFNKGAVMILPSDVNKATGLAYALHELELSPHNAVAVGDAENDHHLLSFCECGVAVANSVAALKDRADWVTDADHGAGVIELIDKLLESDLAELAPSLTRWDIPMGHHGDREWQIPSYGPNILLSGTSGSGKSTFATGLLERLSDRGYQYCVIDPEGDYSTLGPVVIGGAEQPPALDAVVSLLRDPRDNAVVNLLGIPLSDRAAFFERLLAQLLALRARTGRPHWIVVDETHHMLPAANASGDELFASGLHGLVFITVHPEHVARRALDLVDIAIAIGETPAETLARFSTAIDGPAISIDNDPLLPGDAVVWEWRAGASPHQIRSIPARTEHRRHTRKYVTGELPPELSFYFRGPKNTLNLRAQNLMLFMQSADGIDDDTWMYHLKRGDYSRWFESVIKDSDLANVTRDIEHSKVSAGQSRQLVRRQIERRYTAPA